MTSDLASQIDALAIAPGAEPEPGFWGKTNCLPRDGRELFNHERQYIVSMPSATLAQRFEAARKYAREKKMREIYILLEPYTDQDWWIFLKPYMHRFGTDVKWGWDFLYRSDEDNVPRAVRIDVDC